MKVNKDVNFCGQKWELPMGFHPIADLPLKPLNALLVHVTAQQLNLAQIVHKLGKNVCPPARVQYPIFPDKLETRLSPRQNSGNIVDIRWAQLVLRSELVTGARKMMVDRHRQASIYSHLHWTKQE